MAEHEEIIIDKENNCFVVGQKKFPATVYNYKIYKKFLEAAKDERVNLMKQLSTVILDI